MGMFLVHFPRKADLPWCVEDTEGNLFHAEEVLVLKDSNCLIQEGKPVLLVTGAVIEFLTHMIVLKDPRPPWRRPYPP